MRQKTIKINLSKLVNKSIFAREAIKLVKDKVSEISSPKNTIINFSFAKVDFISRSFTDELLNLRETLEEKDAVVNFIDINNEIEKMLEIVSLQRTNSKKVRKIDLKVKELSEVACQF